MRLLQLLTSMLALRRGLAMSAAAGPRELRITQALTSAFAPQHLEVLNESHGRREDESHFKVVVVSEHFAGVKPLIAQRDEELAAWEATPGHDEPRDASWPAQIGVTWVDDDHVEETVAGSMTSVPGENG